MAKLTLADIQNLASIGIYGGAGLISPASAVLGLSAAAILYDLSLWQGSGYELTQSEIDDIEAMIAGFECDLMSVVEDSVMCAVAVGLTNDYSMPANTSTALAWEIEYFDTSGSWPIAPSNHHVKITQTGYYVINFRITYQQSVVGFRDAYLIHYPSVGPPNRYLVTSREQHPNANYPTTLEQTTLNYLSDGDTITAIGRHTHPTPLDIIHDQHNTVLSILRVS